MEVSMNTILARAYSCAYALLGMNALFPFPYHKGISCASYFLLAVIVYKLYSEPNRPNGDSGTHGVRQIGEWDYGGDYGDTLLNP